MQHMIQKPNARIDVYCLASAYLARVAVTPIEKTFVSVARKITSVEVDG